MIHIWHVIFECAKFGPWDRPIDKNQIRNPLTQVVKSILYIFSMETFIQPMINEASRNKDASKI